MGFGRTTKYIEVHPNDLHNLSSSASSQNEKIKEWDDAVEMASAKYDKEMVKKK